MAKRNAENLRTKRKYLVWLQDAKGHAETSIGKAAAAIDEFETHTKGKSFKSFHSEQARAFKRHLERSTNSRTGKPISAATIDGTLRELKGFFRWLADQPGYKSRIGYSDAEYFSPSNQVARQAQARQWKPHPTPEQIRHVLEQMPTATVIERRDRAVIAFLFLTGARDGAAITLQLRHVDLAQRHIYFDARNVHTKRSKTFMTWFFPVGDEVRQIVADWITELRKVHLWGADDPLFPRTRISVGNTGRFAAVGIERAPWSTAGAVRKLFPGPSGMRGFRSSILTEFATHLPSSATSSAARLRSSRPGRRTSATAT